MNRLKYSCSAGFFALLALVFLGLQSRVLAEAPSTNTIPLRILYAGKPGSARETDFVNFLKQHFRQVKTGDLAGFNSSQAADADVVLLDYDGDGFRAPHPELSDDYARPTVTVGIAGGLLCSRLRLKTGYM